MRKVYIETYGCQMNIADSEVVLAIMDKLKYEQAASIDEADVVFVNTCSVRDNAEKRVIGHLNDFKPYKKKNKNLVVGVLGCMAKRQQKTLLKNDVVDLVVGPDAYRELPLLLDKVHHGQKAVQVDLSETETYENITPKRLFKESISGFVSIMRGCNKFCTYCIVPYTRGRERSRLPKDIFKEIKDLQQKGYKEVTLLGQNIDSYLWMGENEEWNFAHLMEQTAQKFPHLRIRFTTSHPKDMSDKLLEIIAQYPNLCKSIHLPIQSGSTRILKKMNRNYTREWYLDRIRAIHNIIPECSITTDFFAGFCTETEEDHQETLSLMEEVRFDYAFMYKYSERPDTYAAKKFEDDIPEEVKSRRLQEIVDLQSRISLEENRKKVGKVFEVLIEKKAKKEGQMMGHNSQNKVVVFPVGHCQKGDLVQVEITDCTQTTLIGQVKTDKKI